MLTPPLSSSNTKALIELGTNPMSSNSGVASKNTGPIDVNVNIKVDAPGMDASQLASIIQNDQSIKQGIISAVGTAAYNGNGNGEPNPNTEARKQYTV